MKVSLYIAPVGLGPFCKLLNYRDNGMRPWPKSNGSCVTGPSPIPALICPDAPELSGARSLRRSRHGSIHSLSYGFTPGILPSAPAGPWTRSVHVQNRNAHGRAGAASHMDVRKAASRRFCQSSPAFRRICPGSVCRITASGILPCGEPMQYAG